MRRSRRPLRIKKVSRCIAQFIGNAMKCRVCKNEMPPDAPIYHARVWRDHPWCEPSGNIVRLCESCWLTPIDHGNGKTYPVKAYRDWRPPLPCEYCGRPIITSVGDRMPLHLRCSLKCDAAARSATARPKQQRCTEQRACACGKLFTPKRTDAIYCSTACKQRAYRQRAPRADQTAMTGTPGARSK